MLVILEGLDNTGKTTIAKMLMQYYKIQGKNATLAKELSTPIGEQIKQLSKEGKLTPELKTYLFAADRRLLLDGLGQVSKDDIVIFDRYVPSAIAYRMADGVDKNWVKSVNKNFPRHDLGFYIDITPETSIKRNTDQKFNILYSYEHLDRVRRAYMSILDEYSLKNIDVLMGIVDGLSLDAGIGFEVGYCIAKRIPIILFSTDFINSKIGNFQKFQYDPICKDYVNIFKYEYINNNNLSYVDELDFNIKTFKEYVKRKMKETLKNYKNNNKLFSEFENDVFIDFSGMKYEWNKKIANNLENKLKEQNYKCIQSDRYSSEFNEVKELEKLISSKILVINYDENEPNFGSSILQGIAYYYNKTIIAYETHQVDYYVDGGQHMGVNLMLEQSATKICRDYNELEKVVLEELKKVV